jgi:DNA-binding transcriptional MocR family regulator
MARIFSIFSTQVKSDNLVLTCGATNGLHLASTTLLNNVDKIVIFVECPTYFIATDVLKKGEI